MSEDYRGHAASVISVTGYEVYEVGNMYERIFSEYVWGDLSH